MAIQGVGGFGGMIGGADPLIKNLEQAAKKIGANLDKAQGAVKDATNDTERQQALIDLQKEQNALQRIFATMSSLLESAHNTAMQIINKIGN